MRKKIITIIGARPQIIKASAFSRAVKNHFQDQIEEILVHTGQHYDENMSNVFFNEMGIPQPNYNLSVGSGSHGAQTGKMIEGLESIFLAEKPDAVLVYGDTNSTIAGALAATKIHIPVIHVEAGLRSFNKSMPEEINRICCDHMSTLLFTPTQTGLTNLATEGFNLTPQNKVDIDNPAVYMCGDVMYDNSLFFSEVSAQKSTILSDIGVEANQYILSTIHRDSNTDIAENLENIFKGLLTVARQSNLKVVLPLHPRTKSKLEATLSPDLYAQVTSNGIILIIDPAGFLDIIALEKNARLIITDSGGLQKEAYFFKKPCLILRPQTEWIEIVENGNAELVGADYLKIIEGGLRLLNRDDFTYPSLYGDGKAAEFIANKILEHLS
ncbi:MAG: UDP-N-acetylglucosamine 2-epimerase (non-hydrolyzing) [Crocinitomicaceae bacterium]|jgi:UDP-GlcNAc3NAcA epimerase|nr:UDP-N-acetylglucosamine 2-epimerase (non-hydrolyzing) [Crocinitomicaceae bacterium]MCF8410305.1 UDP-N-acetylglucosamine 2-epimerase (non-hydrolyzing) [Crocinitomicaceae bacterium]MCF8445210.1 UDP-N-acetylglucosamine 2-epimerase (non-hydrolyzing) [Crocinitomicaceae bacterium]